MSDSKNQMKSLESDPIVEEVVTFNPMELEARYDRAEFAAVVFQNISEVYPIGAHVECTYTITADIVPTSRDWVALYKVGWMNPTKDYVYYEWAPMPKVYEIGKESEASILFPAHKLPGDDGDFYQFCYVSSTGQIRGASTPFQFRKPSAADYVEVDDPDTNMLVIQSRSVYLQENLQAAESQKKMLLEEKENLVKELEHLASQLQETQGELTALQTLNADLKSRLRQEQAHIVTLNKEASDMNLIQEEQRVKIENLIEEKEVLERKIGSVKEELLALTSSLKKLQADKDDLEGEKKNLEEQVNMYKEHLVSSESAATLYSRQLEDLQSLIADKEDIVKHLQENIGKLTRELQMERESFDSQALQYVKSTEKIEMLEEKLRNTEDKLSAAEESRGLAAKELQAYKEIHVQLTADIEKTKTDNHCLKSKVSDLEKDFQQRAAIMKVELEATQQDLRGVLQEKEQAQMQKSQLQEQLETASMNSSMTEFSMNSSMSAMKLALSQLKERLEKKEKQTRTLEKALSLREKEFARCENDLKREIEDLKEKIYMCGEEYKALLIEKSKTQRKLEKVTEKRGSKMPRARSEEVQIERTQTSPVTSTSSMVKTSSMKKEEAKGGISNDEIQQHMDDLEQEMNSHVEKIEKYKKLYNDQKARNKSLQLEMTQQLQEKDTIISQLRKKLDDLPSSYNYKIQSLEKCVAEKESFIEMLNQKLRDTVREKDVLKATASSTSKVAADSSDPNVTDCKYPFYNFHYRAPSFLYHMPPPPYQYTLQQSTVLHPLKYPDHEPTYRTLLGMPLPPLRYPDIHSTTEVHEQQAESGTAQSPLATYPGLAPLVYPGQPLRLNIVSAMPNEDKTDDDSQDYCDTILKPLPPPLKPEVLPMSGVPAFTATIRNNADTDDATDSMGLLKLANSEYVMPSAPPVHEDRFLDAPGEPMKLCPVCNKSFPMDVADIDFENHVMDHVEGICPFCRMSKGENMTDDDFMRHVNRHYEESDEN
ncbi:hypothetical protein ACJMK2_021446 [Sinanodonta woodiana]